MSDDEFEDYISLKKEVERSQHFKKHLKQVLKERIVCEVANDKDADCSECLVKKIFWLEPMERCYVGNRDVYIQPR